MKEIQGLQGVLDQLYTNMLPQCGALIGVAQGIAGFAALWYCATRIWKDLAYNKNVQVYPLLPPFVKGGVIILYPFAIALMNGILQPTVTATAQLYANNNAAIDTLLKAKEAALKQTIDYQLYVGDNGEGNEALWEAYSGNAGSIDPFSGITNAFQFAMAKAYYNLKNTIKEWLSEVLQVVYEAAALCINTIRIFQLVVLTMLGPLAIGFSVFDGWHGSLSGWLARYVHVFLWLPVANIFGSLIANIQVNMLQLDLNQIQSNGSTYFSSMDTGYLVFLILAITGYFTVPTVAGYIVRADGTGVLGNAVTGLIKKGNQNGLTMFPTFKNLDHAFRQLRRITILSIVASAVTMISSLWMSFRYALTLQDREYVVSDGKVLEAFAADRDANLPAEARDHIRCFHQLLFGLDPDEKAIADNAARALYLVDRSGKQLYDNLRESGYLYGIVSGNISQRVEIDSIRLDLDGHPYHFRCYAREKITRPSTITIRSLLTEGWLRRVGRSEHNSHGLLIENFSILENRDLEVQNRNYEK